jgi:hypothetical protein
MLVSVIALKHCFGTEIRNLLYTSEFFILLQFEILFYKYVSKAVMCAPAQPGFKYCHKFMASWLIIAGSGLDDWIY